MGTQTHGHVGTQDTWVATWGTKARKVDGNINTQGTNGSDRVEDVRHAILRTQSNLTSIDKFV